PARVAATPLLPRALDAALELGARAAGGFPSRLHGLASRGDTVGDLIPEVFDRRGNGFLHLPQGGLGRPAQALGILPEIAPHLLARLGREEERDARADQRAPEERAKAAGAALDHDVRQFFVISHWTSFGGAATAVVGASWVDRIPIRQRPAHPRRP